MSKPVSILLAVCLIWTGIGISTSVRINNSSFTFEDESHVSSSGFYDIPLGISYEEFFARWNRLTKKEAHIPPMEYMLYEDEDGTFFIRSATAQEKNGLFFCYYADFSEQNELMQIRHFTQNILDFSDEKSTLNWLIVVMPVYNDLLEEHGAPSIVYGIDETLTSFYSLPLSKENSLNPKDLLPFLAADALMPLDYIIFRWSHLSFELQPYSLTDCDYEPNVKKMYTLTAYADFSDQNLDDDLLNLPKWEKGKTVSEKPLKAETGLHPFMKFNYGITPDEFNAGWNELIEDRYSYPKLGNLLPDGTLPFETTEEDTSFYPFFGIPFDSGEVRFNTKKTPPPLTGASLSREKFYFDISNVFADAINLQQEFEHFSIVIKRMMKSYGNPDVLYSFKGSSNQITYPLEQEKDFSARYHMYPYNVLEKENWLALLYDPAEKEPVSLCAIWNNIHLAYTVSPGEHADTIDPASKNSLLTITYYDKSLLGGSIPHRLAQ